VIDLHLHTTESDGTHAPKDLVARAAKAGVDVLAVTDHDTVAGCDEAATACAARGISFVAGIEVTAVVDGADVHVLGYFINLGDSTFQAFLRRQREYRMDRVREIVGRLNALGVPLDVDEILAPGLTDSGKAPGRPWIARALVAGGHVATADEAFKRWLERGRPGFVPRRGAPPEDVFARVHSAGGIASLAHPVLLRHDEWLPSFASAGLDALEAYHSEHDVWTTRRYVEIARRFGLAVSGGSDYHGDDTHGGARGLGTVALPREEFDRLMARHHGLRARG
jgi:predicted metal-dependent phosphoesterase TrpH